MRRRHPSAALVLVLAVLSGSAGADAIDDFKASWTGQALIAQRLLDLDAPLADSNWIGTHNSFNSAVYATPIRYLDPNQLDSIYNQLRMGARAIELDVHWTPKSEGPFSFPDRLLLCHGTPIHIGCSLDDRYFAEGLDEIAAWLNTADSIDQVLILHIEDHMDGQHGEAFAQVDSRIGSRVYGSGGCGDIPGTLTKEDVLAAGKNVVIWNEGACSGDGSWNAMVFTGLGALSRVWEDSTVIGGIAGAGAAINDVDVIGYFAGGTNLIDLDQLHPNDSRWGAAVWSWDVGEPNDIGGEDCALQHSGNRWNDADCALQYAFACEHTSNGSWAVSAMVDSWGVGAFACAELGPEYRFSVPTNSQDNESLAIARANAGQSHVWLNHDDRDVEGEWGSTQTEDVFYDAGALTLASGESIENAVRLLRLEPSCDLVLYSRAGNLVGGDLWNSGTAGAGTSCELDFQSDGNLVLYDGAGAPVWSSSTSGSELRLQSDGNLVIYDGAGAALWVSFTDYPAEYSIAAGALSLQPGQILHSQNRKLDMRHDCNLVLHSFVNGVTGGVLWKSDTAGAGSGCSLDFQADGNLVVYDGGGSPVWASGTSGTSGGELRMQDDGNLVVYNGADEPLWATYTNTPPESIFSAGQLLLLEGQFVQTQNRRLTMQPDCNLELISFENAGLGGLLWQSDTAGAGNGCYAELQADGNFVVYDELVQPLWDSGTSGTSGAELRMQDDGNVVIYNGAGQPLWTSATNIPLESSYSAGAFSLASGSFVRTPYRQLEMQDDCNLVLYSVVNAVKVASLWSSGTAGAGGGCRVDLQGDGNLVVLDEFDQPLWSAGTSGTSGAELRMQDDGNLVISNGAGQPLWSTSTQGISVAGPVKGDLLCNGEETCESCPLDCGPCVVIEPPLPVPTLPRWGATLLALLIPAAWRRFALRSGSRAGDASRTRVS